MHRILGGVDDMSPMLEWLEAPRCNKGLHFAGPNNEWQFIDYGALARRTLTTADWFTRIGLSRAGIVAIVLPSGPDFVAAFFGTLAGGGTPCPLPPPGPFSRAQDYVQYCSHILRLIQPKIIVTHSSLMTTVDAAASAAGVVRPETVYVDNSANCSFTPRPQAELALVQATSGSSGAPKPVRITLDNLTANLGMITRWLGVSDVDVGASWLPLHHDMGLIGCLLMPVTSQIPVWIMRPDQFVAHPIRWLRCLGLEGVTLTASPSFALKYTAKRVSAEDIEGYDFSALRALVVGSERVDALALDGFSKSLRHNGFSSAAFMPAYGLAEATLSVTGDQIGKLPIAVSLDWQRMDFGGPITVRERASIGELSPRDESDWLVGCGVPHPELELRILDEDGNSLPSAHLGEISIAGPSVASGYIENGSQAAKSLDSLSLLTGDAGFLFANELFVVGRIGDSIKIRGRTVFVEELESKLLARLQLRRERVVVLAGTHRGAESVVLLAELEEGPWINQARRFLAHEVGEAIRIEIRCIQRGGIQWTSSGKPRRRIMWSNLLQGNFGRVLAEPSSGPRA